MKKKGGKRKRVSKRRKTQKQKFDIKKTWQFKALIALVILLICLIILYFFVYDSEVKDKDLGGELPTLGYGVGSTDVNLNVTNYVLFNNNQSINITLERISGNDMLNAINISFNRPEGDCNYVLFLGLEGLIGDGDNKNFTINSVDTNCMPSNFTNITSIEDITAIAGIDALINPIKDFDADFDDYILYKGENLTNINLSEYFECNLDDLNFNGFVNQGFDNISIVFAGSNLSIYPDYGWFGMGEVIINGSCRFLGVVLEDFDVIVSPNLTHTSAIPNVTIYKNENLTDVFDLDDYFVCDDMGDRGYVVPIFVSSMGINIYHDSNNVYGIYANRTNSYHGVLPVTAMCGYDDSVTTYFYLNYTNYTRPLANIEPSFNRTACDDLVWEVNTNYKIDMEDCFYDEDDGPNSLSYRYVNASGHNDELTISEEDDELTLDPDTNWVGDGYFYVYGDDGEDETRGRVDFTVRNTSSSSSPANTTNDPNIKSSSPGSINVHIFEGNKTFSITAENYEEIKWFLNGALVKSDVLIFDFSNLKEGDIVKVEIINGTRVDSKTWNIKIEDDDEGETPVYDVGSVIFYLIIVLLGIIILLVIWLFISEKNKGNHQIVGGFGVSQPSDKPGPSSSYFNIPSR